MEGGRALPRALRYCMYGGREGVAWVLERYCMCGGREGVTWVLEP